MLFKLVLNDIKTNFVFFCILIFNISLGLTGFVALDSFKVGTQNSIKENAKNYLSADLSVSARRLLTDKEVQLAREELSNISENSYKESRFIEMFTMLNTPKGSRLIQLKIIDDQFPFYGRLKLEKNGFIEFGSEKEINYGNKAWGYSDLFVQLNLKVGDKIKLGKSEFILSDKILEDPSQTVRLASIAPKIYIGLHNLNQLGLVGFGSTLIETRLFKLNNETNIEDLKKNLFAKYLDPAVQVQSSEEAQDDSGRVLGYLNDFLGLVSLVGFFLAMIGSTYLYRAFLNLRVKSIAIMNALGLSFSKALTVYILELLFAALLSAILSLLLAGLIAPIIQSVIGNLSSVTVNSLFQFKSMILAVAVALLGVIFSCLPYFVSLNRIVTSQLLQESTRMILPLSKWDYFYFTPLLIFFYLLSIYQSNSFKVGSMFFVGLLICFLILFIFSNVFILLFSKINLQKRDYSLKHALLVITRNKSQSVPVIIALAMASLLINLIPQLKVGILSELSFSKGSKLPSLFLFDIQDDQVDGLKNLIESLGSSIVQISPHIRTRLISINGAKFEKNALESTPFKTREEEIEARFRNRGFNISYRNELSPSEKIVEGQFFTSRWIEGKDPIAELSVEDRFAARLNLKMGDILKFDIQGTEFEGKITSLRSVKWNSFQPNFFVLIQPGVLDEAPKTWLASIPQVDPNLKFKIQEKVSETFSNISSVNIEDVTRKILVMVDQMSYAIQFMSLLSLLAGLFVIYSISKGQSQNRQWDLYLMRVLGARPLSIAKQSYYEALIIGIFSSVIGVILSFLMAYSISYIIFEGLFIPSLFWTMVSILIIVLFTLVISVFRSNKDP